LFFIFYIFTWNNNMKFKQDKLLVWHKLMFKKKVCGQNSTYFILLVKPRDSKCHYQDDEWTLACRKKKEYTTTKNPLQYFFLHKFLPIFFFIWRVEREENCCLFFSYVFFLYYSQVKCYSIYNINVSFF
jgi:hypothetical protein